MKKLLSIILSMVIAVSTAGGVHYTVYAYIPVEGAVSETSSVTADFASGTQHYYSFTPERSGLFRFSSNGTVDTYCLLLDAGGKAELARGDDIDDGNLNFSVTYYCKAGEKYLLAVCAHNAAKGSSDVKAEYLYTVTDAVYTPIGELEYISDTYVYPTFAAGDKITLSLDSGETLVFLNKDGSFLGNNKVSLEELFGVSPELVPVVDEGDSFTETMLFQFLDFESEFDAVSLENPVKSITFEPKKAIKISEKTSGIYAFNKDNKEFYLYYLPEVLTEGNKLTVYFNNGTKKVYTCTVINNENLNYLSYLTADGETLDMRYFRVYSLQYDKPWVLGKNNVCYVEYMNKTAELKVEIIKTGWKKENSKWYYYNADGNKVKGWQKISGKWYYFNASCAMVTGWQKVSGKWYYFNKSGAMETGWLKVSGKWYYFNKSGAMVTGWLKVSGKWYYFNKSGAMQTGWLKLSGKWYYLNSNGSMVANTSKKIGKKTYKFNASGVCTNP